VIARDVGGGFGMKGHTYPEEAVITWAARHVGRPVKWIPSRTEALLTDFHGRDQTVDAELALDADGRFLALRWTGAHNAGAYVAATGALPILGAMMLAPGAYDIPAAAVTGSLVFTNTTPTKPYRGAGRPEAIYIIVRRYIYAPAFSSSRNARSTASGSRAITARYANIALSGCVRPCSRSRSRATLIRYASAN
jgi:carbon-monoxide dehydrogenase large subunit